MNHDEKLLTIFLIVLFAGMLVGFFWGRIYEAYHASKKPNVQDSIYQTMNETQLQVALNNAVDEDRFEDAEKIRKILETKFK
jgi:hypothetical protein